ncbi:hypothetical protein MH117_20015 [Paenibacillus sp. ACRRX]|uniref:hypothetical protein n=1 Tax=Paenibacillus sp. ACRRX TaxID=2918206 RepID=UPI001EF66CD9|nr:hypothetical protein [Paenibacillus sp. ACRRX]MCG7409695.1 hypothetical protein [Paenibacillus sp. ACRRX]
MYWFEKYKPELELIFAQAKTYINQYPPSLKEHGFRYIETYNPLNETSTKNYICYLLPYWTQEATGITTEQCRQLSLAEVFIMLYLFLQDDVMDTRPAQIKEPLALSSLFYNTALSLYRQLFPSESPFWNAFDQCTAEWAEGVTQEGYANYFLTNPFHITLKAAPIKLAFEGAVYLGGRIHIQDVLSHEVNNALIALQMVDDYYDWEEDMAEGNYNSLLAWITYKLDLSSFEELTAATVRQSIFTLGHFDGFAQFALLLHQASTVASELHDFQHLLIQVLVEEANRIQRQKELLFEGGFTHFLSIL